MLSLISNTSIHQQFEFQASQTPDAVAVVFQGQQLTYQELNTQANQLAHYLRGLGVKSETLVGIFTERSLETIAVLLGILKAGGAYVPLDPSYPQERLAFIVEDTHLPILITQQSLLASLTSHQAQTVVIDRDWHLIAQHSKDNVDSGVTANNLAYVIYTSGSTGKPKGVAIEHRSTVALIDWARKFFTSEQLQGVLASTSICFDLSVFEVFVTLSNGGKVILAENALELPYLPSASQVTLINTVPSAIAALLRIDGIPTSVKTINLAGEPLQNSLVQKLYQLGHVEEVINLYGPSEDTTYSTVAVIPQDSNQVPSIGYPINNTKIYLLEEPEQRTDENLNPVPVGTPGEIYIGGAGLARGYLNRPQLTAEKFIHHPLSNDADARLYKTGDLGVYLPDGSLKFLGRIDHQVKIRGYRIELGEIENVLNQHQEVRESVVIPKEDTTGEEQLIAYVVPQAATEESNTNTEKLQQWEEVWNATYDREIEDCDPNFNLVGWNNSYTGLTIPEKQMHEWVESSVNRILDLRPQKVLEIGFGTGLLLLRIAPHCQVYQGTDISQVAVHRLQEYLQQDEENWSQVKLTQKMAHELEGFEPGSFDTVIINSVIQYFPSIDYLVEVLAKVVKLVEPGGKVFIGDVRSLPLLEAFHTVVELHHASDSLPLTQLQKDIKKRINQDRELVVDPDFFVALEHYLPQISYTEQKLKQEQFDNEITKFRSDVILHIGAKVTVAEEAVIWNWQENEVSISNLRQFLQEKQPEILKISNIPNSRITQEIQTIELLNQNQNLETVGEVRANLQKNGRKDINIQEFWHLSQDLPYQVNLTWSSSSKTGAFDLVLRRKSSLVTQESISMLPKSPWESKPWNAYANNPLQATETGHLLPQLRTLIKDQLPDYMMPCSFVIMDNFPLTPNGKIDRRSLPEPKKNRPTLSTIYVAPFTPIEKQLTQIWSQVLSIEKIGLNDSFFELGGHSLLATQLLMLVEEEIKIKLPLFSLLEEPTISGLIKTIDTMTQLDTEIETQIDWEQEIVLDESIYPETPYVEPTQPAKHIFLTGATGFLGGFLLQELLQQTQAKIYCLVRSTSEEEAREKLYTNLERYLIAKGELDPRIVLICGDLAQPYFGLEANQFRDLASKLDIIYHCGAFVNLVYPYSDLRAANVLGTQEILRLASQGKTTPVHFMSTLDVFNGIVSSTQNLISEKTSLPDIKTLDNGYSQSKWVGEKLILAAQDRGIPTCTYRPGMLSAHSQTGASQTNDLICRIIKGIIQMESAPELDQSINLIPIDYAAQAIVKISQQPQSWGQAFHIINPKPLPWNQLIDEMNNLGYPVQLLPHQQWQTELRKLDNSGDNALIPMKSLFSEINPTNQMTYLENFLMTAQAFDCHNTLQGLAQTSILCPKIDRTLLQSCLFYFDFCGFLPQRKEPSVQKYVVNQKLNRSMVQEHSYHNVTKM